MNVAATFNQSYSPNIIAFVGNPKSGKSTAAEIISNIWGHHIVDTGGSLRKIAMDHFGLTFDQCYTQAGKASFVNINGKTWQVRDILGTLGNKLEEMFGDYAMPFMASSDLRKPISVNRIIDPSCRKNQGWFWKNNGGVVIEIVNPIAPASPFAFDRFDPESIDYQIINDAQARGLSVTEGKVDLHNKIVALFAEIELEVKKNVSI